MNSGITQFKPDKLKDLHEQLEDAISVLQKREMELEAIVKSSKEILSQKGFAEVARAIFDHCCNLTGATSGYVALLDEKGQENEVLFLEAGGLPCTVDPNLPMPIRGLRAQAYHNNITVYDNNFMDSKWIKFMPAGHVALANVMFAPLINDGKTVGIMGLANKDGDFDDEDARVATGFGELAAIALQNSRNLDQRNEMERRNIQVIAELQEAIGQVKQLSGLLPICTECKSIRDDKGYWKRIESYLEEHSEAELSHSICKGCAEKLYPEIELYPESKK